MPPTYGIAVRCRNRASVDVGLNVRIGVTVSVPSNKVHVVVVFAKNVFCGQSRLIDCRESQTSCARLVKVRIVVDKEKPEDRQGPVYKTNAATTRLLTLMKLAETLARV